MTVDTIIFPLRFKSGPAMLQGSRYDANHMLST